MAGGFRSGFGVAFGVVIGLVVAAGLVFFGCPMLVCGGLGAIGIAASEAERAQREAAQQTTAVEAQTGGDNVLAASRSPGDGVGTDARKKPTRAGPDPLNAAAKKKLSASAKDTLKYLSAVSGTERSTRIDGLDSVKVRWVGEVSRRVAQKDGQYDLVARCNGARVRCLFDNKPPAAIVGLKRDRRIVVHGTVTGIEADPKMGPTLLVVVEKVNTVKENATPAGPGKPSN